MSTNSHILRALCMTGLIFAASLIGGCAARHPKQWNIDSLRDERAVDIDKRLTKERPMVENPFQ